MKMKCQHYCDVKPDLIDVEVGGCVDLEKYGDEIVRSHDLVTDNGGPDEVEWKLKVLEEIEDLILGYHITASDRFKVAEIKKLLHLKFQLTVGDLEHHARVRLKHPDYVDNIVIRAQHQITVKAESPDDVIMIWEDSYMVMAVPKSTPCERVKG